jgi:hypothetical protein
LSLQIVTIKIGKSVVSCGCARGALSSVAARIGGLPRLAAGVVGMSYQSVGGRITGVPVVVALVLGVSGCGGSEGAVAKTGSWEPMGLASKTSKIAGGMLPESTLKGGKVGSSAAGQEGAPSGSVTPTPTPAPAAGIGLPVKRGGLCSYPNQQGTAHGKTLTCKKGKDGKWRWLP